MTPTPQHFQTYVPLEIEEGGTIFQLDYIVDYTVYPGSKGTKERGTGIPLEPDESPQIEIDQIQLKFPDGKMITVEVSGKTLERILDYLYNYQERLIYGPLNGLI